MKDFKGKVVWIVGASSGIGSKLAEELSKDGALIAISARSEDKLKATKKTLSGNMHKIYPLDVSVIDDVCKVAKSIESDFKKIDVVIFMAASYSPQKKGEQDIEMINQIVNVNLTGALNIIHFSLPILRKQKNSQLALCGSVAGYRGLPNGQPYSATKAAINNLAESLFIENKQFGVDVKLICPGFVKTQLTDKNDFKMPFIIETDEAARRIVAGLKSNSFEVHFPKRLTYILKIIQILPNWAFFKIAKFINR